MPDEELERFTAALADRQLTDRRSRLGELP